MKTVLPLFRLLNIFIKPAWQPSGCHVTYCNIKKKHGGWCGRNFQDDNFPFLHLNTILKNFILQGHGYKNDSTVARKHNDEIGEWVACAVNIWYPFA